MSRQQAPTANGFPQGQSAEQVALTPQKVAAYEADEKELGVNDTRK